MQNLDLAVQPAQQITGHAFEWLTPDQRNRVVMMELKVNNNRIETILQSYSCVMNITYESLMGATNVTFENRIKTIEDDLYNVFLKDATLLLLNQNQDLLYFRIKYKQQQGANASTFFDGLTRILQMRKHPLKVSYFPCTGCNVQQAVSVICQLDPIELEDIELDFEQEDHEIILDDLMELVRCNKGNRLTLFLVMKTISRVNFASINKLLKEASTFRRIEITCAIFNPVSLMNQFCVTPNSIVAKLERHKLNFLLERDEIAVLLSCIKLEEPTDDKSNWERVFANPHLMELACENLQCLDIIRLRKVSYNVRRVINHIHPDPHIKIFKIDATYLNENNKVSTTIDQENAEYKVSCYCSTEGNSRVNCVIVGDHDFRQLAVSDFAINTGDQKTAIEFHLIFHSKEFMRTAAAHSDPKTTKFWDMVKQHLEMRNLRVWKLILENPTQGDILQILPYVDAAALKFIEIAGPRTMINVLELDEVAKLSQWKSASVLLSNTIPITTSIRNLNTQHFSDVDILVSSISSEDILFLKNELLKSSTIEKFKITFQNSIVDDSLHSSIGEPFRNVPNLKKIWYFRATNTDYYLHIVLDTHSLLDEHGNPKNRAVMFRKVEKEDTPFN